MKGLKDIGSRGLVLFVAAALAVMAAEHASAQSKSDEQPNRQVERLFDSLERIGKGANKGAADQAALAEACAALNDYARGNEKTAGLVSFTNRLGPLAAGVNVRSLCLALTSDNAVTFESNDLVDAGIGLAAQTGADFARSTGLPYLTRLELEGSISSRDEASFSLTTVQPWLEDRVNHHYVFNQVSWYRQGASATDDGDPDDTLNIGWGYRRLVNDETLMLGVNAFFDHQLDQNHNRVSIGAEAQTQLYGIGANYYLPLTAWKVVDDLYEARALRGFDVEVQGRHPNHPGLTGYLRGYTWDRYEGLSDIYGYAASVEYFPVKAVGFKLGFSDDNERESAITAGLRVRMNLGERLDLQMAEPVTLSGMGDRVFERVRRENIIRTQKRLRAPAVIYDVAVSESIGANVAIVAGVSQALAAGQQYELPLEIRTADAPGAIARLDLFGGGMLALGRDSHVLISDGEIDLQHGIAQYASGTESVLITTTGGTITLIGTDIDVVSDGSTASVRVRDGSISVAAGGSSLNAAVGEMVSFTSAGSINSIPATDPAYRTHTDQVSIDLDRVGAARTGDKVAPYPNAVPRLVQSGTTTGDEIRIAQSFSQPVTVTGGTPWMEIMIGSTLRRAYLASGSGTDTLVFSYILLAGDAGADDLLVQDLNLSSAQLSGAGKVAVSTFASHPLPFTAPIQTSAFISTWTTTHPGASGNNQIRLPLVSAGTYDFMVDWGDGTSDIITQWDQPERTHTYAAPGTYTVRITGMLRGWSFNNGGDAQKIENISQWGSFRFGAGSATFWGASNLTITATDIPDLSTATSLQNSFRGCSSLTTVPNMEKWDTSSIVNMVGVFREATQFNQPIGSWDTSNVTNMDYLFSDAAAFNQPIGDWNVSKVTRMFATFYIATDFNQPIGNWDTSSVINMQSMFNRARSFNQPIGDWDVSSVTNMQYMFREARLFNQPLGDWDVSSVINMSYMFHNVEKFNHPIGGWDTSNVRNMLGMFAGSADFNQPIGDWDTSRVTNMQRMFYRAVSFNQPIGNWNTSNVTTMAEMFFWARDFNQPIGSWNVSNVTDMTSMFLSSGLSTENYNDLLVGWSARPLLQTGVPFGAQGKSYSAGAPAAARQELIDTWGWTITDAGQE